MPLTCNNFDHLPSARRSILHAIRFGREVDLYEGLDRILQHISNIAECDDDDHTYYYAPQGHVTAVGTIKLRDLDQLHDSDYFPSPSRSNTDEAEKFADDDLENGAVVEDNDEREEQADEELNEKFVGCEEVPSRFLRDSGSSSESATDAATDLEKSFGTSSSTEVPYKLSRLPDFRLSHAWLRSDDGEELIRYNTAVVEVKICTEEAIMGSDLTYKQLMGSVIDDMAPQVIEAVQVAFAERPDQEQIVAIPMVNSFCCFMYFSRARVPPLNLAVANEGKGFQGPPGMAGGKLYETYARHRTKTVQIMSRGGDFFDSTIARPVNDRRAQAKGKRRITFGETFVSHWNDFIRWTRREDLFPRPDEEDQ